MGQFIREGEINPFNIYIKPSFTFGKKERTYIYIYTGLNNEPVKEIVEGNYTLLKKSRSRRGAFLTASFVQEERTIRL